MRLIIRVAAIASAAALILTLLSTNAVALEIEVERDTINFTDAIVVRTGGSFDNKCFQIVRHAVGLYEGLLTIVNEVRYFGVECRDTVIDWEITDSLGVLLPGNYIVILFEYVHSSTGIGVNTQTVEFEIYACDVSGDLNNDGFVDLLDIVLLRDLFFYGSPNPECFRGADFDCDGVFDISDLSYLVSYLFGVGPAPEDCAE